jgi:hypothetical protein
MCDCRNVCSTIAQSEEHLAAERVQLVRAVRGLSERASAEGRRLHIENYERLPRVHFNLVYDGLNNRAVQVRNL